MKSENGNLSVMRWRLFMCLRNEFLQLIILAVPVSELMTK